MAAGTYARELNGNTYSHVFINCVHFNESCCSNSLKQFWVEYCCRFLVQVSAYKLFAVLKKLSQVP